MNAEITIVTPDLIRAYAFGQLDKEESKVIEQIIEDDERARGLFEKICKLRDKMKIIAPLQ